MGDQVQGQGREHVDAAAGEHVDDDMGVLQAVEQASVGGLLPPATVAELLPTVAEPPSHDDDAAAAQSQRHTIVETSSTAKSSSAQAPLGLVCAPGAAVHRLQTGLQEAPEYTSPVRARTKSLQLTTSTTASTAVGSTTAQQGSGQTGSMLQIRSPNSANSKAMSRKRAYDTIQSRVDSKGEGEKFQPHEIADLALAVGLTEGKVKGVLIEMRMRRNTARTKSPGNKSRSSHGASPSPGNSRGGTSRR